jgi:uncharacterized phage-associated protein
MITRDRPVKFSFHFQKTLQAASVILNSDRGKRISYLRLLKLLYIADREMLVAAGFPISGDRICAMKNGPVLSRTYDIIKGENSQAGEWEKFIRRDGYQVELIGEPGRGQLSRGEIAKLNEVVERHHGVDDWDLVEQTHALAEWKKNFREGTSTTIAWEDVLEAQGKAELKSGIAKDAEAMHFLDNLFEDRR